MKHRVWLVALLLLGIASGMLVWHLFQTGAPELLLHPPETLAEANTVPITNPFGTADALPKELSAETFAGMIDAFSEPGGSFMYENFLSNERSYQDPIASLIKVTKPGGAYLGVGPEQNFTYIAAVRPAIAFIVDIRRQNMVELLMYKALFKMASNRAEFVSLLFSRRSSRQFSDDSSADLLFQSFSDAPSDESFFADNLRRMKSELRLKSEDEKTLEDVYRVFFSIGPDLSYSSVDRFAPSGPSYSELMTLQDSDGRNWSFLSSEENFQLVKTMQRKNLIVPLVGDFSGHKAIRTVGQYLKDHDANVSAFYVSNVEMYILAAPQWKNFCANVASLPMDESSHFIRFLIGRYASAFSPKGFGARNVSVLSPMVDVLTGMTKGYAPSYYDLIHASK